MNASGQEVDEPFRLLHLSDFHFGNGHFFRQGTGDPNLANLADAVSAVLSAAVGENAVDCLVLSGDFFSSHQSEDLGPARDELRELLERLDAATVVAVPGNHDVTWLPQLREVGDTLYYYGRLVNDLPTVYGSPADLPAVIDIPSALGERGLALILLDSCRLESQEMAGFGRVGDPQLGTLAQRLGDAGVSPASHVIVAVLHHHLLPITPLVAVPEGADPTEGPRPQISLTVDAVGITRRLAELGVSIILHGHQHHRAVIRYENLAWQAVSQPMYVVAAGSCGSKDVRRQFFLLECVDRRVTVRSFAQHAESPAEFEPDRELTPIELSL